MGASASKPLIDIDLADEVDTATQKRKLEDVDVNWPAKDLEQALEKKRKLEEAQPFNDEGVLQRKKQIGIREARKRSVSEASKISQNVTPRGLSSEGDESSEFVSADETGGVAVDEDMMPGVIENASVGNSYSDSEENDEEDEDESEEEHDQEETQVVQDSMAVDTDAGLVTPPVDRDSGHGSSEDSEGASGEGEQEIEMVSESGNEQPLASGSQDRMHAVEETVRQIKAERSANAAAEHQRKTDSDDEQESSLEGISGPEEDEVRKEYVVERKARKQERHALARQQKQELAGYEITPAATVTKTFDRVQTPRLAYRTRTAPNLPLRVTKTKRTREKKRAKRAERAACVVSAATTKAPSRTQGEKRRVKREKRGGEMERVERKIPVSTRGEKRRTKREKRIAEMERAAREDPVAFKKKLEDQIMVVPTLAEGASAEAQIARHNAMRKATRASGRVRAFEKMVARKADEDAEAGELDAES